MSALKPCPFCGEPGEIVRSEYGHFPSCTNYECPAHTDEQDEQGGTHIDMRTAEEAKALWNTRAERDGGKDDNQP